MKKYKVLVTTYLREIREVEAQNETEAIELACEDGVGYDTDDLETIGEVIE